jgi:hypothetical protein
MVVQFSRHYSGSSVPRDVTGASTVVSGPPDAASVRVGYVSRPDRSGPRALAA